MPELLAEQDNDLCERFIVNLEKSKHNFDGLLRTSKSQVKKIYPKLEYDLCSQIRPGKQYHGFTPRTLKKVVWVRASVPHRGSIQTQRSKLGTSVPLFLTLKFLNGQQSSQYLPCGMIQRLNLIKQETFVKVWRDGPVYYSALYPSVWS